MNIDIEETAVGCRIIRFQIINQIHRRLLVQRALVEILRKVQVIAKIHSPGLEQAGIVIHILPISEIRGKTKRILLVKPDGILQGKGAPQHAVLCLCTNLTVFHQTSV